MKNIDICGLIHLPVGGGRRVFMKLKPLMPLDLLAAISPREGLSWGDPSANQTRSGSRGFDLIS